MFAFVAFFSSFSVLIQEIGWEERLLFRVWSDVEP